MTNTMMTPIHLCKESVGKWVGEELMEEKNFTRLAGKVLKAF